MDYCSEIHILAKKIMINHSSFKNPVEKIMQTIIWTSDFDELTCKTKEKIKKTEKINNL